MSKKNKETLHIYSRVSTTSQSEKGMSLINQRERGIEVSKSLGMEYKIWNEGGKSSFSDDLLNRPILMSLVDGWKDGSVKNVYVTDFDRLSRKGTSWYVILRDIEKYGINVYVGSGTKYDINDEYDKLMLTIVSGVSQFDNTQRTRRFQQNKVRKFCEGYYVHGTTPFGYEKYVDGKGKKLKEHTENGKIVRKLYDMFSKGKTIKDLQIWLEKSGVKSPRNNFSWGQQQILNLLKSKTYIGEISFTDKSNEKEYKGKCPSVVNKGVWYTVQRRFTDYFNEQQQSRKQTHEYLLTGILFCGVCGYRMRGLRNLKTYRNLYYCGSKEEKWRSKKYDVCDRKSSKSVNIDRLDDLVWNEIVETIRDSSVLKEMKKKSIMSTEGKKGEELVKKQLREKSLQKKELELKHQKFQNKRHQLMEWLMNDTVTDEEYNKLFETVEKNIWEVSSEIEEVDVYISRLYESKRWVDWYKIYMDDVSKWEKLTKTKDKKELLRQYLDRVEVKYLEDDNLHKVEMFLRLKLFNDKYVVTKDFERDNKGRIKKGREYEVVSGDTEKVVFLNKTKVGRKKKRHFLSEKQPSVSTNIIEDEKPYNTNTVSHGGVDGLCSISPTENVDNFTPYLLYTIKVLSGSLYKFPLTEKQRNIYKEIKRLRKDGLTYKQISNNLNERGWTTTRDKKFSDGTVWGSEMKMEKRFKRFDKYKRTIEDLRIQLKYDVDKETKE